MREIKFRAWDKENNRIFDVVELSFEDGITLAWREPYKNEHVNWMKSGLEVGKECLLMQFTGLYDSKGNPIYEGDLVRYKQRNLEAAFGMVEGDDYIIKESEIVFKGQSFNVPQGFIKGLEVIGDIYRGKKALVK